jgi:uncharacterized protein (DUF2147 family)
MTRSTACAAALLALAASSGPARAADAVGEWLVADKTARIGIAPCAENRGEALCGSIVWTKSPPGLDEKNPDPAQRTKSVLGLRVLKTMKPAGANRWEGEIYNAKDGRTYKASMSLEGEDGLKIEGCVLGGLFCGGETWTRTVGQTGTVKARRP